LSGQSSRSHLIIASAIVIAGILISASLFVAVGDMPRTSTTTETMTITETTTEPVYCSAAGNQTNDQAIFNLQVYYQGRWNASVSGYTYGATTPAFTMCYTGDGNGVIAIAAWVQNPTGGQTINATIQKGDGTSSNLTAVLGGIRRTTTTPYGSVMVFGTALP
jgi:hypothetical protein